MRKRTRTKKALVTVLAVFMALALSVQTLAIAITSWNPDTDVYTTTDIDGINYGYLTCTSGTITYNHSDQNGTKDTLANRANGDPTADDRKIETGTITFSGTDWTYVKNVYDAQGINYTTTTMNGSGNFNFQEILSKSNGADNILSVAFSAGTYNMYGPFRPYSYVTLKRSGTGTATLKKATSRYLFINTDDTSAGITAYSGSHSFHIENLTFDCNDFKANVIKSVHAGFYTITNCVFQNGRVAHVIEWNSMKDSTIDGCTFQNIRTASDGTYLDYDNMVAVMGGNFNEEVMQIEGDSSVVDAGLTAQWGYTITEGQQGFLSAPLSHDNTVSTAVTVKNSSFINVLRGIGHHWNGGGVYQTNVVIKDNYFEDVLHHAIYLRGYKNVSVTGNQFYHISAASLGSNQGNRIHLKACVNSSGTAYGSSMVTTLANANYYKKSDGTWSLLINNTTDRRIVVES